MVANVVGCKCNHLTESEKPDKKRSRGDRSLQYNTLRVSAALIMTRALLKGSKSKCVRFLGLDDTAAVGHDNSGHEREALPRHSLPRANQRGGYIALHMDTTQQSTDRR